MQTRPKKGGRKENALKEGNVSDLIREGKRGSGNTSGAGLRSSKEGGGGNLQSTLSSVKENTRKEASFQLSTPKQSTQLRRGEGKMQRKWGDQIKHRV